MTAATVRKLPEKLVGLSDDGLEQMLALAGGADSVELKPTVPDEIPERYPDGSRILELSTECVPAQMFQVVAESRAFLAAKRVDLSGEQQTKTAAAVGCFVTHLQAGAR